MSEPATMRAPDGGALPLADWGLIRARGPDAATFLHGQLTQDVEHLGPDEARLAAFCSAKGRMLASFVMLRGAAEDEVLLACSADLLAATLRRLQMFVLRAKCRLDDAGADLGLHGLVGPAASGWLGATALPAAWGVARRGGAAAVRLPDAEGVARYLWIAPRTEPAPALPALPAADWERLEVKSGIARVVAATADQLVPQMANFELVGGVNFKKGCYPGQEVVARSQYRGTLKRRAFIFEVDAEARAGQEVFDAGDPAQPAGLVVNAARGAGRPTLAIVEVKRAAMDGVGLHLAAADGPPLRAMPMPYAVPDETA